VRNWQSKIALSALTAALMMWEARAGVDQPSATVETPASVSVDRAPELEAGVRRSAGSRAVVVVVSGYQPPLEGSVQVVVKAVVGENGVEREIGRFGVMPRAAFSTNQPEKAQRFRLSLPSDVEIGRPGKLKVYLVPSIGDGAGARLYIEGVEVE
jgi:hypothetical protein